MYSLLMFLALFILIFLGFPVAFSLISVAFAFGLFTFGDAVIFQFISKIEGISTNFILAAVPLFVFMGSMQFLLGNININHSEINGNIIKVIPNIYNNLNNQLGYE